MPRPQQQQQEQQATVPETEIATAAARRTTAAIGAEAATSAWAVRAKSINYGREILGKHGSAETSDELAKSNHEPQEKRETTTTGFQGAVQTFPKWENRSEQLAWTTATTKILAATQDKQGLNLETSKETNRPRQTADRQTDRHRGQSKERKKQTNRQTDKQQAKHQTASTSLQNSYRTITNTIAQLQNSANWNRATTISEHCQQNIQQQPAAAANTSNDNSNSQ